MAKLWNSVFIMTELPFSRKPATLLTSAKSTSPTGWSQHLRRPQHLAWLDLRCRWSENSQEKSTVSTGWWIAPKLWRFYCGCCMYVHTMVAACMCPTSVTAAPGLIQSPLIWWQTKPRTSNRERCWFLCLVLSHLQLGLISTVEPLAAWSDWAIRTQLLVTWLQHVVCITHTGQVHTIIGLPSGCDDYVSLA